MRTSCTTQSVQRCRKRGSERLDVQRAISEAHHFRNRLTPRNPLSRQGLRNFGGRGFPQVFRRDFHREDENLRTSFRPKIAHCRTKSFVVQVFQPLCEGLRGLVRISRGSDFLHNFLKIFYKPGAPGDLFRVHVITRFFLRIFPLLKISTYLDRHLSIYGFPAPVKPSRVIE